MNVETGEPLDMLSTEALKWAKSIGSKAESVTEVINTKDPLVSKLQKFLNEITIFNFKNENAKFYFACRFKKKLQKQ